LVIKERLIITTLLDKKMTRKKNMVMGHKLFHHSLKRDILCIDNCDNYSRECGLQRHVDQVPIKVAE